MMHETLITITGQILSKQRWPEVYGYRGHDFSCIWEYSPTLADEFCFCIGETREHASPHWAGIRVNTSYERIVSYAEWQFQTRASESQGNSATILYDECPNHLAITHLSKMVRH